MNFDLHKPCNNCPFLKDGPLRLTRARAKEIAGMMASSRGGDFPCHKTIDYDTEDREPRKTKGTQHCAGALLFMEKVNPAGTQMIRIAQRLRMYDPTLYTGAELVFDSVAEMVEANSALNR